MRLKRGYGCAGHDQNKDAPAVDEPQLCTVNQAADILCVSRQTVTNLMDSGKLPYLIVGCRRRIPRKALVDLANSAVTIHLAKA